MADKNESVSNRRVPLLKWMASAAIVLVIFGVVGAHVHSRSPGSGSGSQSPIDVSSQSRTPR